MYAFRNCFAFIPLFSIILRHAEGAECWGRVLGSCMTRCLRPYLWCCTCEVKFAKNAFFGRFDFVSPFPIISWRAGGAGGWGRVLGSCRTRRSWVYLLWFGQEGENAQNAHFGRFVVLWLFCGSFGLNEVWGTLPRVGGRSGSQPFHGCNGPGTDGGHWGVWARFRSYARCGGSFLSNKGGGGCLGV
jgi:hypothetical protein